MSDQNPQSEITLTGFDATTLGVGAMIGPGVFVLTGIAAGEAGPAAIIAFAKLNIEIVKGHGTAAGALYCHSIKRGVDGCFFEVVDNAFPEEEGR